ncbi:MAG: hypothetical protein IT327_06660 [Anaerolineae bacterium]|nr:hypothetical protein [Anaerolineae bacterium]
MLHLQRKSKKTMSKSFQTKMPGRHWRRLLPLALLVAFLSACAPGEAPPEAICDTYNRALFTTQLVGGASVLLGLAMLGLRKNLTAILPSQGAQLGAVAGSVALGLILLAFSTDIGNQILTGFSIESMYTLCGLG